MDHREIAEHFPGRITIAEDLRNRGRDHRRGRGWRCGVRRAKVGSSSSSDPRGAIAPRDEARHMATVAHALTHHHYNGDAFHRVIYTEDSSMFTAPGIPMLFQGQEVLQGDWFQDTVPLRLGPERDLPRHRPALSRPHPAAAQPQRCHARAHRTRHRRASDRRGAQARRLPPLAGGWPGRRRRGGRELQS